jgi:hypothetical protein
MTTPFEDAAELSASIFKTEEYTANPAKTHLKGRTCKVGPGTRRIYTVVWKSVYGVY